MGRLARDLTGLRINKLHILFRVPNKHGGQVSYWRYRCFCGRTKDARGDLLFHGKQKSCGCERLKNKFTDITGKRFGKLVAQWPAARGGNHTGRIYWLCLCDCGRLLTTEGKSLRLGLTTSCGCSTNVTHGLSKTPEYGVLSSIRKRARKNGIPFDLTIEDVTPPEICPILGIPIFRNKGKGHCSHNSPAVDRFIPSLGYTKGNVQVVSQRANWIKSNASLDELKKIVEWMSRREV